MNQLFFQYNMDKNGIINMIMEDSIIILDANALLNVYRYNSQSREKYIEILDAVKDRMFLTYQAVQEFYENRLTIIYNKHKFKEYLKNEIQSMLDGMYNTISNDNFTTKNKDTCNLIKYEESLKVDILKILNESQAQIVEKIDTYNVDIGKAFIEDSDPILEKMVEIFANKINNEFEKKELEEIYKEGKKRYELEIPPGYKDKARKPEPDRYGDLVIWKEMIKIAKEKKQHVLFVSDDRKEDWCDKFKEYEFGPRKELIKEFFCETKQYFHSITTKNFIKYISNSHNIDGTEELEKESDKIREELININRNNEMPVQSFGEMVSEYVDSLNRLGARIMVKNIPTYMYNKILNDNLLKDKNKFLEFVKSNLLSDLGEMDREYLHQTIILILQDILNDEDLLKVRRNLSYLQTDMLTDYEEKLLVNNLILSISSKLN
ncbi:hypothetical protein D2A34_21820 [Clostridium chromiireducens]|uniref:PIN like domain-containing protein n=1 Tax=Clostridium chromiireducens TaxID=225345 RepID=A0A399IIK0_9CLOT|nr:PIN-like domain-containing protein [Clostridium chromiireducens]RII32838.1 hypothetical protein D2A34_21820 [Clostridium chromiireducens]